MKGRAEIIIPVRNNAALLRDCLVALRAEVGDVALTVVDDASSDTTSAVANEFGARVMRHDVPLGPYAARNEGWRTSSARLLVFTDVRCRPKAGWWEALVEAVSPEGTAIAGCDIQMRPAGRTVAERWAIRAEPLRVSGYIEHPFLPYVPTACLAVGRSTLEVLGGFSPVRSGADADLCWRAQLAGLGDVAVSGVGMWAIPRDSSREVLRQFARYGKSGRELQRLYAPSGHPAGQPRRIGTSRRALRALWESRADPRVGLLDAARIAVYERSFRAAAHGE